MMTMEYLSALGLQYAAGGDLASPIAVFEYDSGRGLVPLASPASEQRGRLDYAIGWEAAQNERETGRVNQIAVLVQGQLSGPESRDRPGTRDSKQEVLMVSSWRRGDRFEHVIYGLRQIDAGGCTLAAFERQPDRIASPVLNKILAGYEVGQADLKLQRNPGKDLEL